MNRQSMPTRSELKCMLCDENAEPKALSLSLLEEITNGFSEEQEIGRGGFAVVYKGMLDNGVAIAVKRLSHTYMYEKQFHREVECLIKVKHKNVVRFIGYCVDSQGKAESYNGKFVMAEVPTWLLCFEYLPYGTLDKYITDASCGLDWRMRYKIINGICNGLHYLHQNRILHLDLKPPNILLDGNMLPKIADFGLSRCFGQKQSRAITSKIGGTIGYMAPEFGSREITYRFDLYSLGVIIIEILTGKKGYEDVENVLESWSNRLEKSHKDIQREQVRVCTEIGLECIDSNPAKRPVSMQHIIARLYETKNTEGSTETVVSRSSTLQTSSVFGQVDSVPSMVVSAKSSDQLLRISPPKGLGETHTEDSLFYGSSVSLSVRTMSEHMPVAVLAIVVRKIGFILGDEAAKPIVAKLTEKVPTLKDLPVNMEQITKQLIILSNFIRLIGTVYLTVEVAKNWIWKVRYMAYHVEDVMDKYSYHVSQLKEEGFKNISFTKGTRYVNVFREIVDDVAQIEKEIQLVIQMRDKWFQLSQVVASPLTEMERQWFQDSFPEFVKDKDLVGIEDNRTLLAEWLYSKKAESTVITVSGMGGLGKSTLVSTVYEREKINFPAHAWIAVSQVYTASALLRKLLRKIGYPEQTLSAGIDKMDVHDLKREIQNGLRKRKYLIVLDDVWDQEVYVQMHGAFPNLQGSRIVITTRMDHVARISSPTRHLELQPLSKHDAFDLFCRRAFYNQKGHKCPKDLAIIATSIVDMCHGLPLAIVSIGSLLSSRHRLDIWNKKYNHLRSEMSNNDHVRAILNLSYHDLSGDLRNCLLYCSLFPEHHPMSFDHLVRLWVAEGFVISKDYKTPEMVAEGNLMELIHRNMLEVVETDEFGRVNTCKMHDLVRDLVISIAKEERFASANYHGAMIHMDKDVRRLSLYEWKDDTAPKVELPCLRTVVALGVIACSPGMLSSILAESCYLTVLELQGSEVTEVPTSVGSMFNLRYIGLQRTMVKLLPDSIQNLSNLHTLDIKQTKIEKLPPGIVKIKKLRHLLAGRYAYGGRYSYEKWTEIQYFIGMPAPKELSNLKELQTLDTVESSNDLAEQLKKLMQLRSVWIDNIGADDCADLFATLSTMPLLSSLHLSARDDNKPLSFEALKPRSTYLHSLIIRGQWANGTLNCPIFLGYGTHIKYLALSWCHLREDPLGMLALHMPNLTYLRLSNMRSANTLVLCADSYPNLKTLVLKYMPTVRELKICDGALPCIEGLYVVSLRSLHKVPQGIESLRSLKRLWLLDLHKGFESKWLNSGMHQKILHVPEVRV